jgi:hypothetical protein
MGFSFRKSFRVGPFRTTVSHRGITNSIGAAGLRYSKTARFADLGSSNQDQMIADDQPAAAPEGNPIVGLIVLAVIGYVLYKLLT